MLISVSLTVSITGSKFQNSTIRPNFVSNFVFVNSIVVSQKCFAFRQSVLIGRSDYYAQSHSQKSIIRQAYILINFVSFLHRRFKTSTEGLTEGKQKPCNTLQFTSLIKIYNTLLSSVRSSFLNDLSSVHLHFFFQPNSSEKKIWAETFGFNETEDEFEVEKISASSSYRLSSDTSNNFLLKVKLWDKRKAIWLHVSCKLR